MTYYNVMQNYVENDVIMCSKLFSTSYERSGQYA